MDLSIIIPCYNCSETILEAYESINSQELKCNYEIIMVDDKSEDNTLQIIQKLSSLNNNTKVFNHDKNLGGGATRNTAIKNSKGEYIFCLDSDDILAPNCLKKMLNKAKAESLDGVTIHESRKFIKNKSNIIATNTMGFLDQIIPFNALFEDGIYCGLYSTFLIRKEVHDLIGGYPEDHGFDTQHYAFRFLANNYKAKASLGSIYYHRLSSSKPSYYIREYKSGRVNFNWYKILVENLYLLSDKSKSIIINYDIYGKNKIKPLIDIIKSNETSIMPNKYIVNNSNRVYYESLKAKKTLDIYEHFWLCSSYLELNKYSHLKFIISNGLKTNYILKMFENEILIPLNFNSADLFRASKAKILKIRTVDRIINKVKRITMR